MDAFVPLSGANAFIGNTFQLPPEKMAVKIINQAGGINGHLLQLVPTDSGSDPVDAVPAMQRMLIQHSNVQALIGIDSSNATALAPVLNQHHLVSMTLAGPAQLDRNPYKYFFELASPDILQGAATAEAALKLGYKRAALMFDSSGTAQSNVPGIVKEYEAHGGKIVLNETLPVDQASYRTEVERLSVAHAQVLFTETDPQTAATLFSNMKQLGVLGIPVIGGGENDVPSYFSAVAKAVGGQSAESKFMYIEVNTPSSSPGLGFFNTQWKKMYPKAGAAVPAQFSNYDGVNIMALAMDEAHSSNPMVYVKYMKKVTYNPGGIIVGNYPEAYKDLRAGKKIQYEGASGQLVFNQYNWPPSGFELLHFTPSGGLKARLVQSAASVGKYFK